MHSAHILVLVEHRVVLVESNQITTVHTLRTWLNTASSWLHKAFFCLNEESNRSRKNPIRERSRSRKTSIRKSVLHALFIENPHQGTKPCSNCSQKTPIRERSRARTKESGVVCIFVLNHDGAHIFVLNHDRAHILVLVEHPVVLVKRGIEQQRRYRLR